MIKLSDVEDIIRELWPAVQKALAGKPVELQGCILADLTAIWPAGHFVEGSSVETYQLRAELLKVQLETTWDLIPVEEERLLASRKPGKPLLQ